MAQLGIKDKYLKRLRDNGLLGYSRRGDKYWYTQADIDRFLARCHYDDFTNSMKGGLSTKRILKVPTTVPVE